MKYHPHISHPGYGWIEPIMSQDDPLIADYVAKAIIGEFRRISDQNAAIWAEAGDLLRKMYELPVSQD